jgi:hypothetical protein
MPAAQVFSILDGIRQVHRQLAARYHELDKVATDERIQLLLEDMQKREQAFDDCIARYESEKSPAVLNTWLQFVPDEAVRIYHIAEQLTMPRTLEDLVEETLSLNTTLIDAYRLMADEAPTPELSTLFADLAKLEVRNDCHYAKMLLD